MSDELSESTERNMLIYVDLIKLIPFIFLREMRNFGGKFVFA